LNINGTISRRYNTQRYLYRIQVIYYLVLVVAMYKNKKDLYHIDHLGSTSLLTDSSAAVREHLEYTPWHEQPKYKNIISEVPGGVHEQPKYKNIISEVPEGVGESWYENRNLLSNISYKFTGKELDPTGLYYFGARYYDPQVSLWISPDPMLVGYLSGGGKSNGGIYNSRNSSLYMYSFANPVRYTDPDGLSTWTDGDGNVKWVDTKDYDKSIYRHKGESKSGPYNINDKNQWEKAGETKFMDAYTRFENGEVKGKINFGVSKDKEMYALNEEASKMKAVEVGLKSLPKQYFDVKRKWRENNAYLFEGKYFTGRELGNVLAGMNAAVLDMPYDSFQILSGYVHNPGLTLLGFVHPAAASMMQDAAGMNDAPMFGEVSEQYFRSIYGYNLCK